MACYLDAFLDQIRRNQNVTRNGIGRTERNRYLIFDICGTYPYLNQRHPEQIFSKKKKNSEAKGHFSNKNNLS